MSRGMAYDPTFFVKDSDPSLNLWFELKLLVQKSSFIGEN